MFTAKESSSETTLHTPIGDSSSLDEILFTKRRCYRCIIEKKNICTKVDKATNCSRKMNQPKQRSCNNQCNQTDPPIECERAKPNVVICEEKPAPSAFKECRPPTIPNFPEESEPGSVPSIPDLFPFNNMGHEFHHNVVSMESSQIALLTKQRVEVKNSGSDDLKITFNDSHECICIHVPRCIDGNQSGDTDCCKSLKEKSACEIEKGSDDENQGHAKYSKEKCCSDQAYHGKSFVDCEETEKYYDYPDRNRKYEVMDKECRDFNENIHYRIERAINPDTNVVIGNKEFPCHLLALQVYSKKIDDEIRPALFRLELPSSKVSPEIFQYLMDWILASEENKSYVICSENVVGLYCASKFLKISELHIQCNDFIKKRVNEEDPKMIAMWEETRDRCDCEEVQILFSSKLSRMFMKIYKSGQFLHFKVDEMIMILDNDSICITSEMDIYDAVVRWLLFDWKEREQETNKIMRVVRFGLISPVELMKLKHCMKDPHYPEIFTCEVDKMIQNGIQYSVLSENYNRRPGELKKWIEMTKVCEPRPRLCLIDYYVHSGDLRFSKPDPVDCPSLDKMESKSPEMPSYENISEDRIQQIKILLEEDDLAERQDSAARIIQRKVRKYLRKKIIILGGCDPTMGYECRKTACYKVFAYDNKNWEEIAQMPEPRSHFSAIYLNGFIFIIGGCDPRLENYEGKAVATKSVWCWNIKSRKWTQLASMITPRSHFGCVAFNGLIYVFGGKGEESRALAKCEMYNPERNKWTETAPLVRPSFCMAATKHHDFIWLIGGLTQSRQLPLLDTVNIYKPEDNDWTHSEIPFPFPIGYASALVFKGEIYVFGGVNKFRKSLDTVFRFDFEQLSWLEIGHLQLSRHANSLVLSGSSAVLIGGVSFETKDVLSSVESFNLKTLSSNLLGRLPCKMSGVAAICLQ